MYPLGLRAFLFDMADHGDNVLALKRGERNAGLFADISHNVKLLRQARLVTLDDLSEMSGIGVDDLANVERQARPLAGEELFNVARALRCDVATLMKPAPSSDTDILDPNQALKDKCCALIQQLENKEELREILTNLRVLANVFPEPGVR